VSENRRPPLRLKVDRSVMIDAANVEVIRELSDFPQRLRGGGVAIGNFDGVHRGHARLVERLKVRARQAGGPALVFTFDPHPVRILRPEAAPPPLTWTDRKTTLLTRLGVDAVIAYRTDEELLALTAREFFDQIIGRILGVRVIVEGPNFQFGRHREGNVELLQRFCRGANLDLEIVEPLLVGGQYVSSSRVRELIRAGNVDAANQLLTEHYRIRGMVTHGDSRGTRIGFPTANLDAIDTLLPGEGIYAGRGTVAGRTWPAAIHIGPIPTFGLKSLKVEVHLLGFRGALYGTVLEVDFFTRLRDILHFATVDELKQQLERDVAAAADVYARDEAGGSRT